ncbi:hypothetical protein AYO48_00055 [Gaiella sp. SCGC AG-212-M14]|nr:hypothetical protein AYO48_00055 [Gaiella sp. SCGC AG-212-M14]
MELLFQKADLSSTLEAQTMELRKAVDALRRDEVLGVSEADLVAHLVSRFEIEVPRLDRDQMYIEEDEVKMDVSSEPGRDLWRGRVHVPGTRLTIVVPYSGEQVLFGMHPNQFTTNPPRASVAKDALRLTHITRQVDPGQVKAWYEGELGRIEQWLGWIDGQVQPFNNQLEQQARTFLTARRERLFAAEGAVAEIGLPVRRRGDAPAAYPVGVAKKKRVAPKPTATEAFKPEHAINMATYDDILATISQMTEVIERSPHAFATLDEEALRTHLLVPLNSQYEGGASAETFNYEGKTDILIRHDGRVVFIAECKIWKGKKTLLDAIEQIRGYLSWRDTKAAVIVFVRNRDFGGVLEKITPAVETAPGWKRTESQPAETSFRFIFGQRDDQNREIILTVLLLPVPSPDSLSEST